MITTTTVLLVVKLVSAATLQPVAPMSWQPVEDRTWKLSEKSESGAITEIVPGMTKHECDFAVARIKGEPATPEEKHARDVEQEEQEAQEEAFMKAHNCKGMGSVFPGAGGEVLDDGSCLWGVQGTSHSVGPNDIVDGECFQ